MDKKNLIIKLFKSLRGEKDHKLEGKITLPKICKIKKRKKNPFKLIIF